MPRSMHSSLKVTVLPHKAPAHWVSCSARAKQNLCFLPQTNRTKGQSHLTKSSRSSVSERITRAWSSGQMPLGSSDLPIGWRQGGRPAPPRLRSFPAGDDTLPLSSLKQHIERMSQPSSGGISPQDTNSELPASCGGHTRPCALCSKLELGSIPRPPASTVLKCNRREMEQQKFTEASI